MTQEPQRDHDVQHLAYWQGERLSGSELALALGTDPLEPDRDVLYAATSAKTALVIPLKSAGRFLRDHEECWLVCYDAARLHWRLLDSFRASDDSEGEESLWKVSRRCRLVDLMLLDQRLRHTKDGVHPTPRSRVKLFEAYAHENMPLTGLDSVNADAREQVKAIWSAYVRISQEARRLSDFFGIPEKLVDKFGPAGVGIDVQGAIALGRATRLGMTVDASRADELFQKLAATIDSCSARLRSDEDARHHFHWEDHRVAVNKDGSLSFNPSGLRKWVLYLLKRLVAECEEPLIPPADDNGELSLDPEKWGDLVQCQPLLRAWRDLHRAACLSTWLPSVQETWECHPEYTMVPHAVSSAPDLSRIRESKIKIFRPRQGRCFVVASLRDLELRCWARVCEYRVTDDSRVGWMFRDGEDPVTGFAEQLFQIRQDADWETGQSLEELSDQKPDTKKQWICLTRLLLWSVSHGITPPQLFEIFRHKGLDNLVKDVKEAGQLRDVLCSRLCIEAHRFLEDPTLDRIARRIGVPAMEIVERIRSVNPSIELRRALEGNPSHVELRGYLEEVAETKAAAVVFGEDGPDVHPYLMLASWPITTSGRIGSVQFGIYTWVSEVIDLADEIRKLVAYGLVASGYQLVAHAGDDFVLELKMDDAGPEVIKAIEEEADTIVNGMIGNIACKCCLCREAVEW